ncbi:zinc-dependent peptidase [Flavobacterium nackdongense]|nr:zinc-dependent peptidase [Flavobacterium nackdongense]
MIIYHLVLIYIGILFLLLILYRIVEPAYMLIFNKPLYIHFYLFPKKLTKIQKQIIEKEFLFFKRLTPKNKIYFEHRVASFIKKYPFIGKEEILITDEMKIIIAATYISLTFGMRHYLIDLFTKIIVYPSAYFSTSKQQFHKGEFNPKMKAVVFSWEDFILGHQTTNDNINLGLHEFSHILHFHGLKSNDPSAIIFYDQYNKVITYYNDANLNKKLSEQGYFREYAYENRFEFIAVILEHFFETPQLFKINYPELYQDVSSMINYDENNFE